MTSLSPSQTSMTSLCIWGWLDPPKIKHCFLRGPKIRRVRERKIIKRLSLMLPSQRRRTNSKMSLPAQRSTRTKGTKSKQRSSVSYFRKGFHPENACMKKKLDEMTLFLERYNINLPESVRKRDNHDQDI